MAANRLPLLLLLVLSVLSLVPLVTATSFAELKVCSTPACVHRNGTHCDRMTQACPRCVMDDPLLGTPICTRVQPGRVCLINFTLCPATPLDTAGSNEASDPGTLIDAAVLTTTTLPTPTPTPMPSPRPANQSVIANSVESESARTTDGNKRESGVPTWSIVVVVGAVAVVASLVFGISHKRQHAKRPHTKHTMAKPPPSHNKKGDVGHYERSTNALSSLDDFSPTFHSLDSHSLDPTRSKPLGQPTLSSVDYTSQHPSSHLRAPVPNAGPTTSAPTLAFSCGPDSYRRNSSISMESDMTSFMETNRSAIGDDIDVFETRNGGNDSNTMAYDARDSLGVDDMAIVDSEHPYSNRTITMDDDEVDIYPDTSMTMMTEHERMFSPTTVRTQDPMNFTTFSIDDDSSEIYPDTSVTALPGAHSRDVIDDWESHHEAPDHTKQAVQQELQAKWTTKYADL